MMIIQQTASIPPEQWQEILRILLIPIMWIFSMQREILNFFLHSPSAWIAVVKYLFLLFPLLLWIGAIWCTQLSLYTLPFRSRRINFITTMLLAWWDAARGVWLFWTGLFRLVIVLIGWIFSVGRLVVKFIVEAIRQIVTVPFTMTGRMTKGFFKPGVPWVAFFILVFWCMLEAVIFAFVLFPTISEVLMDIVGTEQLSQLTMPLLFIFLLLLIMGSFAALQALVSAIEKRQVKIIIQMVIIEIVVMGFEVVFLYRELVDYIIPGLGIRAGVVLTLVFASLGWIAIRGMTWFLFAQYGTPSLLAFISRRPVEQAVEAQKEVIPSVTETSKWWQQPLQDFKNEIDWLHKKFSELLEFLTLPVLQILAVILNFCMILLTARPVFSLPFKELKDVMATRDILVAKQLFPKEEVKP